MKNLLIIVFSVLLLPASYSQSLKKGDQKKFDKALEERKSGNFDKAIDAMQSLIQSYPQSSKLQLEYGITALELDEYQKAIEAFETVLELEEKENPRLLFTLANSYSQLDEYGPAIDYIKRFLKMPNLKESQINLATNEKLKFEFRKHALANPVDFVPEVLPSEINSTDSEYLPSFTADGKTLIYTRRLHNQEDFFLSSVENDSFQMSIPISQLNTSNNEGAHCLSADGQYLFFTGCHFKGSIGGCDLYLTKQTDQGWIEPINLGENINTRDWDAQPSLTALGDRLYFSSTRKNGSGKSDLWYTQITNGKWGAPVNLGKEINTNGNEASPFIHPDGKTLYFRSDGHIGMGDYDLFYSQLENGKWSTPKNLGYPINTKGNEGALIVSTDGSYAYYSGDMGTQDHLDILRFELPESLKPDPVSYIKVLVSDTETKKPLPAKLTIYDLEANQPYTSAKTDNKGMALATLTVGKNYSIYIESDGYLFHSENIEWLQENQISKPTELQILLEKIPEEKEVVTVKESKPVVLRNIFFASGSSDILPQSSLELQKLQQILIDKPDAKIKITGHTDDVGSDNDNRTLSLNRAKAVKQELTKMGIADARVTTEGKGETSPIVANDTDENREMNRRVEFVLFYE